MSFFSIDFLSIQLTHSIGPLSIFVPNSIFKIHIVYQPKWNINHLSWNLLFSFLVDALYLSMRSHCRSSFLSLTLSWILYGMSVCLSAEHGCQHAIDKIKPRAKLTQSNTYDVKCQQNTAAHLGYVMWHTLFDWRLNTRNCVVVIFNFALLLCAVFFCLFFNNINCLIHCEWESSIYITTKLFNPFDMVRVNIID